MAQIYPQYLTETQRSVPKKRAEILVYDELSRQLSDDWLVLYSSSIKYKHEYGVSTREADFLIAHPRIGILVLEVKGGSIKKEGNSWFTTPLSDLNLPKELQRKNEITPYTQVTDTVKKYERKIKNYIRANNLPKWDFKIGEAVCFPDIEIPPNWYLGSEALSDITIDRIKLLNIKNEIYKIINFYKGDNKLGQIPDVLGIELLIQILAHSWEIPSFLSYQLESAESKRKHLTEEQFRLLYQLKGIKQLMVNGCAGSGKTMIAFKKAHILASEGKKVLFTCFNENLAQWLATNYETPSNLYISNFHQLCYDIASSSSEVTLSKWTTNSGISENEYFNKILPEALELAAMDIELFFDAIIIDEGQDFHPAWLNTLQSLLSNKEERIFYFFYDDNQKIYNTNKIELKLIPYALTKNMRNTNQVFKYVSKYYYQPDKILPSGINGPEPLEIKVSSVEDEWGALQNIISELKEQKIKLSDIMVLTPRSKTNSIMGDQNKSLNGSYGFVWGSIPLGENQVRCSTIHNFKGLESSVVILAEQNFINQNTLNEMSYVGSSRARDYLIVITNTGIKK